jgi:hypothetical protein
VLKQAKAFIQRSSANKAMERLKWNTNQLWWTVRLLTGYCHLKGHLFKLGLVNSPRFERCLEEEESDTHILCDCEAIAYIWFHPILHLKHRIDGGMINRSRKWQCKGWMNPGLPLT